MVASIPLCLLAQQPSPRDVLIRFCERDQQGEQLDPAGRQSLTALFVAPDPQRINRVTVIRDFVVGYALIDNDKAEIYVEYVEVGRIALPSLRISDWQAIGVRRYFKLTKLRRTNASKTYDWHIAGQIPEPHLRPAAAIRLVKETAARTDDPAIRKNTERLISRLMKLQQ